MFGAAIYSVPTDFSSIKCPKINPQHSCGKSYSPCVVNSFIIFCVGLIYLKVPKKINELLNKLILDIKNEIDESEKLRAEAKVLLDNSQIKLESAQNDSKKIINETKKESENLIIEMNDKFHKSSEIKKNLVENKK